MESTITAKLATTSSKVFDKYQFLSPKYWFGTPNELGFAALVPLEIIATLIFIVALTLVALKFSKANLTPPDHKFFKRAIWLTLFFGPVGWLLIIFRNIGVVFLSARFFWIIWFGLGLVGEDYPSHSEKYHCKKSCCRLLNLAVTNQNRPAPLLRH